MRSAIIIPKDTADTGKIRAALQTGLRIKVVPDVATAMHAMENTRYDIVFADLTLLLTYSRKATPQSVIQQIQSILPTIEIVVMAGPDKTRQAVQWVKAGAADYVTYPLTQEQIRLATDSIVISILRQSELDYLRTQFWKADALDVVRTKSAAMADVFKKIQSVAPTKTTVLMSGETGTGKTILAKLIHQHSNRQNAQFISVHCGAIPDNLIESELFGHEKGAFTGAVSRKVGLVESARGGTLFLDEIGDVPLSLQVKLLRLLETGTYRRVGGTEAHKADFRLVCATHRGLKEMVDKGEFRQDLYYRINTFPIDLPPLRKRQDDLPLLIDALLHRFAPGREVKVSPEAMQCLKSYDFPGNIRELRNMIERALLLADGDLILPEHLPPECRQSGDRSRAPTPFPEELIPLDQAEERYLRWATARFHGEKKQLAEKLGVSERTLYRKLSELGLTASR
jgi:DNA-binding NtrC family response regulator